MKNTFIISPTAITLFLDNQPVRVDKGAPNYQKVLAAINLADEDASAAALTEALAYTPAPIIPPGFVITESEVSYSGRPLAYALAQKVRRILNDGVPLTHFEKFWENLQENPSSSSILELYDFLAVKELPITDDGHFIAYKGVQDDYWSVSGNKDTVVINGEVNDKGQILNTIDAFIEVKRGDVDDDRNRHCSHGLHVGALSYASTFGVRTVVVKVNPRDVVSVPTDYGCAKCRVAAYSVVAEYVREITAAVVGVDLEGVPMADDSYKLEQHRENITNYRNAMRVIKTLNTTPEGIGLVDISNVAEMVNFIYGTDLTTIQVLDILNTLGIFWTSRDDNEWVDVNCTRRDPNPTLFGLTESDVADVDVSDEEEDESESDPDDDNDGGWGWGAHDDNDDD